MAFYDIVPMPASVQDGDGVFRLPERCVMKLGSGLSVQQAEEFAALWHRFSCRTAELAVERDESLLPNEAVLGAGAEISLNESDEYALAVGKSGVRVLARNSIGLLHGLYTLLQLIIPTGGETVRGIELGEVIIHDRPRLKMRAVHLCLFPENTLSIIEKAIRLAGIMKYSHVCLEFWGTLQYDCLSELAWKNHSWSKQQIRRLIDIARSMGLEVIPMFNHLGHAAQSRVMYGRHTVLDQNPALQTLFEPDGWTWCLSNEKVHHLLRAVREELIELCGDGEYFHLGCDEAYSYASCPLCRNKDSIKMLADFLNGLTDELMKQGRRPMIWGDALLDAGAWQPPVIATSRSDQRTHLVLETLDRRMMIADWQYGIKKPEVPSAEYFISKGFDTVLCPWDGNNNVQALGIAAERIGAEGLMMTTWHHLPEMLRLLNIGAEYGWRGEDAPQQFSPTGTAALLRRVMPEIPTYEEAGFGKYEVPQPDRWLMK